MDIDQFRQILLGLGQFSGQNNNNAMLLQKLIEENVYAFLNLNLMILSEMNNPTLCAYSITLIYTQVKNRSIFKSFDDSVSFWLSFSNVVPQILQSEAFPQQIKSLTAHIIGYYAAHFYNINQNTQIQEFLLFLWQNNPNLETFIIEGINDVIYASPDFGGFSTDIILQLLTKNLLFQESFIPRVKLFLGIAMKDPSNQTLINNFPILLQETPENLLQQMIKTLSIFAETSSAFFEPHLPMLVQLLCKIAINVQCPYRNDAIFCIESIFKGNYYMCVNSESFYVPVLDTIISVMAEIDDNIPLEKDLNNDSPCIVARSTLKTFFEEFFCDDFSLYICNKYRNIYFDPNTSWPILHAIACALIEMKNNAIYILTDSTNFQYQELVSFILIKLQDFQLNPHLKIALYQQISKFSKCFISRFQEAGYQNLLPFLLNRVRSEDTEIMKKYCAKALTSYFEQFFNAEYMTDDLFLQVILAFSNSPNYLHTYFIRCLSAFLKEPNSLTLKMLPVYFSTIYEIYQNSAGMLSVKIQTISSYSKIISKKKSILFDNQNEIATLLHNSCLFLRDALLLYQQDDDPLIEIAILDLLGVLQQNAKPIIEEFHLFDYALQNAHNEINITIFEQFDEVGETSFLEQIPSNNLTQKQYINKEDVKSVIFALKILTEILMIYKHDILQFYEQIMEAVKIWIFNDFHIESAIKPAYYLISTLIGIIPKETETYEKVSEFFYKGTLKIIGNGSFSFNNEILLCLSSTIPIIRNSEFIIELMNKLVEYASRNIEEIKSITEKLVKHKMVDDDDANNQENLGKKANYCQYNLDIIASDIFPFFLEKVPEISLPFCINYIPTLQEYLKSPASTLYALGILIAIAIANQDLKFIVGDITLCMNFATKLAVDISSNSFNYLSMIFQNCDLPKEVTDWIINFFVSYLSNPVIDAEENTTYAEHAIGAFSLFLIKYRDQITNYNEYLKFWVNVIPIIEDNPLAKYQFELLANLFEEKNEVVINQTHFERLVDCILTNIDYDAMMTPETSERFKNIFREIAKLPENKQFIESIMENILQPSRKEKFIKMISFPNS